MGDGITTSVAKVQSCQAPIASKVIKFSDGQINLLNILFFFFISRFFIRFLKRDAVCSFLHGLNKLLHFNHTLLLIQE